jgi:hypothetical protein
MKYIFTEFMKHTQYLSHHYSKTPSVRLLIIWTPTVRYMRNSRKMGYVQCDQTFHIVVTDSVTIFFYLTFSETIKLLQQLQRISR